MRNGVTWKSEDENENDVPVGPVRIWDRGLPYRPEPGVDWVTKNEARMIAADLNLPFEEV